MAGCSNTTFADFQFPVSISIVNTIAEFVFKKKRKCFKNQRKERFKHAQNMNLLSANIGSNMIKT